MSDADNRMREIMTRATVIPVYTPGSVDEAVQVAKALARGGIEVIEVTLRNGIAMDALKADGNRCRNRCRVCGITRQYGIAGFSVTVRQSALSARHRHRIGIDAGPAIGLELLQVFSGCAGRRPCTVVGIRGSVFRRGVLPDWRHYIKNGAGLFALEQCAMCRRLVANDGGAPG